MRYARGELLGDLVLSAEASLGSGKILVLGDTSSFQNPSLWQTHGFVRRVFGWLSDAERSPVLTWVRRLAALLSLGWLLYGTGRMAARPADPRLIPLLAAGALFGHLAATAWDEHRSRASQRTLAPEAPLVLIDVAHGERYDRRSFEDGSLTGLWSTLHKAGFLGLAGAVTGGDLPGPPRAVALVAPSRELEPDVVHALGSYMDSGGLVLLAVGHEESAASRPLLDAVGLDVRPIPLGALPILPEETRQATYQGPLFAEAWPVGGVDPARGDHVFHTSEDGLPVVVFRPRGRGGFLLIADSRFLLNEHVEVRERAVTNNTRFLKQILLDVQERGLLL